MLTCVLDDRIRYQPIVTMAENNCVVCFKSCRIYSMGECDHQVCFECSTRMRVLCRQNECPICRHEMGMVVFTERIRPFRRLKTAYTLYDSKYHIAFENGHIKQMYERLLHFVCTTCPREPVFESIDELNDHMRRHHELFCCDLCADILKIFPSERRYYTKQELHRHKRIGDVDDKSHRGHPLCEFCNVRYFDRDELYKHLRKDHLFCHFCDSEGIQLFYGMYDELRDHYRKKHFLCEEGECMNEKLTSAYATEVDLKFHKALVHHKNSRKSRTLELEFPLPSRHHERSGKYPHHSEEASIDQNSQTNQYRDVSLNMENDFPSLTNSFHPAQRQRPIQSSNRNYTLDEQNFPALSSDVADPRPSASVSGPKKNHVQVNRKLKKVQSKPDNVTLQPSMWVAKTKAKKPTLIEKKATFPVEAAKPPDLSGNNFPNLQKNGTNDGAASGSESNKKLKNPNAVISTGEEQTKINYSQIILKNAVSNSKMSTSQTDDSKEKKKDERSQNCNNEKKTHNFLLTANRKKVKMKPDVLVSLNELSKNQNLLHRQTLTNSVPGTSCGNVSKSVSEECKALKTTLCYKKSDNEQVRRNNTDTKTKGKPDNYCMKKNKEKNGKDSEKMEKPSLSAKRENQSKEDKSEVKRENCDEKSQRMNQKVDVKNSQNMGVEQSNVKLSKPPPGFGLPIELPPPPGFVTLQPKNTVTCRDDVSSCNGLLTDEIFVYVYPDDHDARNAQLIDDISSSLKIPSESAINDFKNTSRLFREGYIPAMDYYVYCVTNINCEKFQDLFVDLITLLPNIVKQQELWAVHQSVMPSAVQISPVDYCTVCFQILKLDDIIRHYRKHDVNNGGSL